MATLHKYEIPAGEGQPEPKGHDSQYGFPVYRTGGGVTEVHTYSEYPEFEDYHVGTYTTDETDADADSDE